MLYITRLIIRSREYTCSKLKASFNKKLQKEKYKIRHLINMNVNWKEKETQDYKKFARRRITFRTTPSRSDHTVRTRAPSCLFSYRASLRFCTELILKRLVWGGQSGICIRWNRGVIGVLHKLPRLKTFRTPCRRLYQRKRFSRPPWIRCWVDVCRNKGYKQLYFKLLIFLGKVFLYKHCCLLVGFYVRYIIIYLYVYMDVDKRLTESQWCVITEV